MNRKTMVLLIGFAAAMLAIGLLLPSILELAFSNQDGTTSVEIEAINYDSGSATLMDLLNLINSAAEISYQTVQEGYHYNQETAAEHAADLMAAFLSRAGFENAAAFWRSEKTAIHSDAEAVLVAVPEFPTPWNAIIWNVTLSTEDGHDASLIFDDTTGSFLAGDCLLSGEEAEMEKSFGSADLIEKLAISSEGVFRKPRRGVHRKNPPRERTREKTRPAHREIKCSWRSFFSAPAP